VKGGCKEIVIRHNRLEHAGDRAMNIGGSTGPQFFRPALDHWPRGESKYEARDITVEANTIVGSNSALCFVNVDGAIARANTIVHPQRWAIRILQETRLPGFVPSRGGVFRDNLIVFRSDHWIEGGCNVGEGTAAETAAQVADLIGRRYGYTFNGRNLSLIVRGACHVSNSGPGIAAGMVNYLLRCGDDGVYVTRACHKQACRLFPSALFDPRSGE
jgi:hypothetical protein